MQQLILDEKLFRHFSEVNTAVIEMNIESRSIPSPPVWEDRLNEGCHNMHHEVLCMKYALWEHRISQLEAVDAPK
jgi:hypothetical protein